MLRAKRMSSSAKVRALRRVRAEHAVAPVRQPDDGAHGARDTVRSQTGAAFEARLGAQVVAHRRTVGDEGVPRERRRHRTDAVRAHEDRVPPGPGPDLQPLLVVGELHRRGQRDSQTVGEELHRDVEQLLLVVDLEREPPEVGDHRLLALPKPKGLERGPGLVDVDAQSGEAAEPPVLSQPGHALVQDPPVLRHRRDGGGTRIGTPRRAPPRAGTPPGTARGRRGGRSPSTPHRARIRGHGR